MNAGLENTQHASIHYYDGDYPSEQYAIHPENFDDVVPYQGLAYDVQKYERLASSCGSYVLELYCGSGRVTIPLINAGYKVTAVDFSKELLRQLNIKMNKYAKAKSDNLRLIKQDVTKLKLDKKDFDLIICPFNSLSCITAFNSQQKVLKNAAVHLRTGGVLVLDLMNPLILNFKGDEAPRPFFTRINPHTGNRYTRFAAMGPIQADQKQKLYGWYDEILPDDTIRRKHYEMHWRPIFRYEIELMLEKAGFKIVHVYGGHKDEPFLASSG